MRNNYSSFKWMQSVQLGENSTWLGNLGPLSSFPEALQPMHLISMILAEF